MSATMLPICLAQSHLLLCIKASIDNYKRDIRLAEDGYDVDYQRVPVTDEKAPKERDFVFLVRRLWQQPAGTALVFNCQMGRGRTSTGMIIASLLLLRQACNPLTLEKSPNGRLRLSDLLQ